MHANMRPYIITVSLILKSKLLNSGTSFLNSSSEYDFITLFSASVPAVRYLPAGQGIQEVAPAFVENVPGGQSEHIVEPSLLYVPGQHV